MYIENHLNFKFRSTISFVANYYQKKKRKITGFFFFQFSTPPDGLSDRSRRIRQIFFYLLFRTNKIYDYYVCYFASPVNNYSTGFVDPIFQCSIVFKRISYLIGADRGGDFFDFRRISSIIGNKPRDKHNVWSINESTGKKCTRVKTVKVYIFYPDKLCFISIFIWIIYTLNFIYLDRFLVILAHHGQRATWRKRAHVQNRVELAWFRLKSKKKNA